MTRKHPIPFESKILSDLPLHGVIIRMWSVFMSISARFSGLIEEQLNHSFVIIKLSLSFHSPIPKHEHGANRIRQTLGPAYRYKMSIWHRANSDLRTRVIQIDASKKIASRVYTFLQANPLDHTSTLHATREYPLAGPSFWRKSTSESPVNTEVQEQQPRNLSN